MAEPKLNYVTCPDAGAGHRMAYWEWGDPQASHTVLCVHGLSRQGRDFDVLAQTLVAKSQSPLRVVCPDVVGRGKSEWLEDPQGYQLPQYASDMLALLSQLQPSTLDWVGTSMGGLIGIGICGQPALPLSAQVRRLVLNDVGPSVQWEAIVRIGSYLGRAMQFDSLQQAADAMLLVSAGFGAHTPAQWLQLSQHMVRLKPDGGTGVILHYDPAIAVPFRATTQESAAQGEALLWQLYDGITAHTLLLRGADSDLLSTATALAMVERGPHAQLVEFAGVGHAPTLMAENQTETVASFLLR